MLTPSERILFYDSIEANCRVDADLPVCDRAIRPAIYGCALLVFRDLQDEFQFSGVQLHTQSRPLVRPEDFDRYAGFEAVATVDPAQEGQRRFRGKLFGMVDGKVRFELKGDRMIDLPFECIGEAKLVLTDELVKAMTPPKDTPSKDGRDEEVE